MGSIYTISPRLSFLHNLADGIIARWGSDPQFLSKVQIFLPNRRSCRTLSDVFLRQNNGKSLLLPSIKTIGDTDDAEWVLYGADSALQYLDVPQGISVFKRKMLLAELVAAKDRSLTYEQSFHYAEELAGFLDEVQRERHSLDGLRRIVPEELAEHWQATLEYMEILIDDWPKKLAELGGVDPVELRNRLIEKRISLWKDHPPDYPVIVAGTTASSPTTVMFLEAVFKLDNGYIILPGLDLLSDESCCQDITETHPQYTMQHLLDCLCIDRSIVSKWHGKASPSAREYLMTHLMMASNHDQTYQMVSDEAFDGLYYIETTSSQEESAVIAVILREALEIKGITAALITQDRLLARRVSSVLKRWDIVIDDSSGQLLIDTQVLIFMRLALEAVVTGFATVPLLALLRHSYCMLGYGSSDIEAHVDALEVALLRGVRKYEDLGKLIQFVEALETDEKEDLMVLLQRLETCFDPFIHAMKSDTISLKAFLLLHIHCVEQLASSDQSVGKERLWSGSVGSYVSENIDSIMESVNEDKYINPVDYSGIFSAIFKDIKYWPEHSSHHRIAIMSPMEARLHHYDTVILGGMNEGSWPIEPKNYWMSKKMRESFGLPSQQKLVGVSAHDFASFVCAPEVVFTRAARVDGTQTMPTRWLLRMKMLAEKIVGKEALAPTKPWLDWARLLNEPNEFQETMPPEPTPAIDARPKRLPVTQIDMLMRNPYAVYARYVLQLRALETLDKDPSQLEFGNLIHQILERYVNGRVEGNSEERLEQLLHIGADMFETWSSRPTIFELWWPRFESIAKWLVELELERGFIDVMGEVKGSTAIGDFTLYGTADRIEVYEDGVIALVDYKTGTAPKISEVKLGLASQLTLEALIAESGGFKDIAASPTKFIEYWKLSGYRDGNKVTKINDIDMLLEETKVGLKKLIALFADATMPYLAYPDSHTAPKYDDYAHLARVKAWAN